MMTEAQFYDVLRASIWVAIVISAPILVISLGSGLVIGLFQALTSVQENSLTFVPKLFCILAVFWMTMGFMSETVVALFTNTLIPLIEAI